MNRRSTSQKSRSNLVRIAQLLLAADWCQKNGKRALAKRLRKLAEARK